MVARSPSGDSFSPMSAYKYLFLNTYLYGIGLAMNCRPATRIDGAVGIQ
jgi:hypothetical protein